MEIEVGEYVRTKIDGYIGKKVKDGLRKGTIEVEDNLCSWLIDDYSIEKHSKNKIDLIQKGDYINGEKVTEITKNYITIGNITYAIKDLKGIKKIVTKEQFTSVEYVFEEE